MTMVFGRPVPAPLEAENRLTASRIASICAGFFRIRLCAQLFFFSSYMSGGQNNDGNMRQRRVLLLLQAELEPVFNRHHQIQKNQVR